MAKNAVQEGVSIAEKFKPPREFITVFTYFAISSQVTNKRADTDGKKRLIKSAQTVIQRRIVTGKDIKRLVIGDISDTYPKTEIVVAFENKKAQDAKNAFNALFGD